MENNLNLQDLGNTNIRYGLRWGDNVVATCPVCGEPMYGGNYRMVFIQQERVAKNTQYNGSWRFVPLKKLQEEFGNYPDCPEALKIKSKDKFLAFDTWACINPIIQWLNSKGKGNFRKCDHYGMIRSNKEAKEAEEGF